MDRKFNITYSDRNTFWVVKKLAELAAGRTLCSALSGAGEAHDEILYYRTRDPLLASRLHISPAKKFCNHSL
jgi:hypothetical protein